MDLLDEWAAYMAAGGRRPATIAKRRYYVARCIVDLGGVDPLVVTTRQLIAWMAGQTWQPQTRKSARAALVGFYRWAVAAGYLVESPAAGLPQVITPPRIQPPADDDVINSAIAAASDRDRLMLLLGSRAGLRRAEIAGLAWSDIRGGRLVVRDGKGGRSRVVPLSPVLRDALRTERALRHRGLLGSGWRYHVDPSSPWVFPARAGGPMSADTVGAIITRAMDGAASSHGLRRRFGTSAYHGTRDIRAVQELLGHSSVATTQQYISVNDDDLAAAVMAAA